MNKLVNFYGILLVQCLVSLTLAQRVAPGVPPQHYEQQYQQPPQQQQYHQQQQYQQPPQPVQQQQYQQPPNPHAHVQPQFQPQPAQVDHQAQPGQHQQQPPVRHGHNHGHGQNPNILSGNVQEEKEHIAEHMEVPLDTSKMTEQELQFHYFKMHDSDNNNKLDGCELIKSLIHWHEQGSKEQHHNPQQPHVEEKVFTDDELISLIDPILQMDDSSHDGYIDYPEFVKAQQKAAAKPQP